ncbi:MAG: hypothetical protein PVF73_13385 [Bacteroidales bacterium]|jgi:Spy/CpxP family protein refolding chaperone
MKKMLIISGMAALITLSGSTAFAQYGQGRGYYGEPGPWRSDSCRIQLMVDDLSGELSLTEEQREKIEKIHYAHIREVNDLRNKYWNDCVEERNARFQLREKMDADVVKVLNEDQQKKYYEFMGERRGPHGRHHRHWD